MIGIEGVAADFFAPFDARREAARVLRIRAAEIKHAGVLKRSLDCRRKPQIKAVYNLGVIVAGDESRIVRACRNAKVRIITPPVASLEEELLRRCLPLGEAPLAGERPVVVGSGPAGLFCALTLALLGARPRVIERGARVEERVQKVNAFFNGADLDENCNVQFGEGGAGTFSDGKLSTGIGGGMAAAVVAEFARCGGGETLTAESKPHIGTDVLPRVVAALRKKIEALGGEFFFDTAVTDIKTSGGALRALVLEGKHAGVLDCSRAVFAVGHSARDVYRTLFARGAEMTGKPFAVGVRIEHLQKDIDVAQFGMSGGGLPAADYKLTAQINGRGCYTFCMCPGGEVVAAASEAGGCVVNGMSASGRGGANADSALIVTVTEADFGRGVLDGVAFQRKWERLAYAAAGGYAPPVQRLDDFKSRRVSARFGGVQPSCRRGYAFADLNSCLPAYVCEGISGAADAFARKIPVFNRGDSLLSGVETRTSAPVRILRGADMQSSIRGLYPCGEGAGYAGGITSAAVDGVRVALSFIGAEI